MLLCTIQDPSPNSTPYQPKMNGAVETANKYNTAEDDRNYEDQHEKLPFVLYAYQTSIRASVGATPYSLVQGMEAVFPIQVEIPSLRVLMETELEELNGSVPAWPIEFHRRDKTHDPL